MACEPDVVPATLAQLKGLRSLTLQTCFHPLVFEAGCFNMPNLLSLKIESWCSEKGALMLPCVTGLQRLTCIEFSKGCTCPILTLSWCSFPSCSVWFTRMCLRVVHLYDGASPGLFRLPADMGALRASLLHLHIGMLGLPRFPLALTQLVALESLDATENHFAELPGGITALSRLTELRLGRVQECNHGFTHCSWAPLDVRALGDLSGFPALRKLTLKDCQAMLCPSLLGAVRHASLANLCFDSAHPAPECAPMVLQLSWELRRLRRGSVVTCALESGYHTGGYWKVPAVQGRAACRKFEADMNAYGQ